MAGVGEAPDRKGGITMAVVGGDHRPLSGCIPAGSREQVKPWPRTPPLHGAHQMPTPGEGQEGIFNDVMW